MSMKYTNDEINRFLERRLNPNLYSDVERSVDQVSLELENLLPHPLLNDVMVALYHIKMKLIVYFTKHTVVCENYLFHYSTTDEPTKDDFILTFDATCIYVGQINGETTLFDESWSVLGSDNQVVYLNKNASRKITGIELIEPKDSCQSMEIISPLNKLEFLNLLIQRFEQSSKIIEGKCMNCGDTTIDSNWLCEDCKNF